MIENFSDFYFKNIHPDLIRLDKIRKDALQNYVLSILVLAFLAFKFTKFHLRGFEFYIAGIGFFISAYFFHWYFFKGYIRTYKIDLLSTLFQRLMPGSELVPELRLTESDYERSLLFQGSYNKFKGEDFLEGKFIGMPLRLSEIHVQKEERSGKRKKTRTVFKGLMIICEVDHQFKSHTIIEPDLSEQVLGEALGELFQKVTTSKRFELMRLENPIFEKNFKVFGDDQVEARRILTPVMQEKIVKFKSKIKENFGISIQPGYLCFALKTSKDYFDPPTFTSCQDQKIIRDIVDVFQLIHDFKKEFDNV